MMELKHISAGYSGKRVLKDVSLGIQPGELTVLAGPNGSGKSTLLRCAARLLPFEGEIRLSGRDTAGLTAKEYARKVAYLPQSRPVPGISAKTLVLHGRFAYLGYPRRYAAEDLEKARAAMERTGAAPYAEKSVADLSGGERQKVYLAMALAQETPVLLLDEPTTYLDISHQLQLMRLAKTLAAQGRAVVMVLHELNLALRFADRVAVLHQGGIRALEPPGDLCRSGVLEAVFGVSAQPVSDRNGETQYLFSEVEGWGAM